jgi:hypothetical protein
LRSISNIFLGAPTPEQEETFGQMCRGCLLSQPGSDHKIDCRPFRYHEGDYYAVVTTDSQSPSVVIPTELRKIDPPCQRHIKNNWENL